MIKADKIHYFLFVSIVIIFLDYFGLLNFIKRPIDGVVSPLKKEIFRNSLAVKNFGTALFLYPQLAQLYQERAELSKKQEELAMQVRQLTAENTKLRMQLEAPFPPSFKFVPSQVISISRFMEIDAGSDEGVKVGQIVVDGQTLVGKVHSVSPVRSKIALVSDPDFKISAVTSRGTHGEVIGQSAGTVILSKVLQKDPLFLGDQVMTTGEEFTPANLLIGKISHITLEETATYKQAKVEPLLNLDEEKIVFVVTSL